MESNFRSTVLQHPAGKDEDRERELDRERERRHPRDILNPTSSVVAPPSGVPSQGPPRHSAFSLRSPTQSEFHPPPTFPSPSNRSTNHDHSPPRPALSSFMSPSVAVGQTPRPPPAQHTPTGSHHHAAPPSPMRASPAYYSSQQPQESHQTREKQSGRSFYDPTTDTSTNERRVASEAGTWHRASTPKSTPSRAAELMSFSNILTSAEPDPRFKPASPEAPESKGPSRQASPRRDPGIGREPSPERTRRRFEESPSEKSHAPESERETGTNGTLEKEADDTDNDASVMKVEPDTEPEIEKPTKKRLPAKSKEKKEKAPRKSKGRVSDIRDAEGTPKSNSRRGSSAGKDSSNSPRVPAKRQANGQPKNLAISAAKEKTILAEMELLDAEASKDEEDADLLADEAKAYGRHSHKRIRTSVETDGKRNGARRHDILDSALGHIRVHTDMGKRRYDELYYEDALHEVREREVFAEKERKKDMQRKRRREKSMAATIEQKEAALAKARAAGDENERQKHLREAARAGKKAEQTKLVLQNGFKGPVRGFVDSHPDGGSMTTFQASDAEPSTGKKSKGRGSSRPKKSKEQKQAEKASAEAAQAALDAGEELPPPKEEGKIRIKVTKKAKQQQKAADAEKDKENKEPKPGKEKEKAPPAPESKFQSKGYNQIYDQIWRDLARKDVNKTNKLAADSYATKSSNLKKTAILASKEAKRWQLRTNKGTKDQQARAKRVMRDMMGFWKRNEREERDLRKAAERQELENQRKEDADREAARQKRKLNFLISQTELYSHFIGKKIKTDEVERSTDNPELAATEAAKNGTDESAVAIHEPTGPVGSKVTNFENLDFDNEDESHLRAAAAANAQSAIAEAQRKARAFNNEADLDEDGEMNFQNPTGMGDVDIQQPKMLTAVLKEYQLKGLNWLVNLYEQGINGILADEMGLGKTVQSISVMAYLAEKYDIWGPYLVVAPASTLHNWEQEIRKFVPDMKIIPYWGSGSDRKILRKFWDRKHTTYKRDSPFHVCITSYQMVVSDVSYFQKMRWQYMILDEAQAIKSSQSSRWKSLLGFHCRNRLLLTGTPIQNNMQELWALLHFIMPSLFDSHDEFSEWFSKDIESHAQSNTKLNEDQLKRLHMILKPFMLRRVKKHVQKELGDKIELDVFCNLTYRQRAYYRNLRNQISIMDLIEKATTGDDNDSGTLMNLVMQFRKVCNHPDLFERADTSSPYSFGYFGEASSFTREGNEIMVKYSSRNLIDYHLPKLIWRGDARLALPSRENQKAGWRNQVLTNMMNIFTPDNIRERMSGSDTFSWLRFADASAGDVYKATHSNLVTRAVNCVGRNDRLGRLSVAYCEPEDEGYTPGHALFLIKERSSRLPLAEVTGDGVLSELMNVARTKYQADGLNRLEQAARPAATAPPIAVVCFDQGTVAECENSFFNIGVRRALYGPSSAEQKALIRQDVAPAFMPPRPMLPAPDNEKKRFNNITVPSMRRFVTDSGKLAKLDELLFKLKNEGHRVLLYFQMTRMIDLMEEYLTYRNYKYCRLDGSTKLEDRRDTVHDFQTRPEIFIFLLSTRAGGLGINLTAADTVIFYDSDWNPTIDSQAMDRSHRLGQTRQVTVYRLITRGTIEERIRKRALQKEEVQRVVISGGGASVDFSGRRMPENRNRDIAMWLADDEQAEEIERRERELLESGELEKVTKKKGKRKRAVVEDVSLDEMYHEGEGNFDDKNASGTATPTPADSDAKIKKRKTKKAKTAKERLAMADGDM
ncbi:related to DNA-dependent ATPase DOMINO B [Cephalotrichum gorgonifer]|uniref:Chromatin-remodeling ATPase INO80 n=1 Tax=Cephalotrichum gorgonifer TaxID=2041049 RepID=A0AAE8MSE8_9PEZI|nr:related to DNA-dependent ATPase DOMINO B [Cephalotrichum gorgonifer]